jgi:hypothetical protein
MHEHAKASLHLDEGLTRLRQALMIAAQTTPARDPGEATLDHPSSGKRAKPRREEFVPIHLLAFGNQEASLYNPLAPRRSSTSS